MMSDILLIFFVSLLPGFFLSLFIPRKMDLLERLTVSFALSFLWLVFVCMIIDTIGLIPSFYYQTKITFQKAAVTLLIPISMGSILIYSRSAEVVSRIKTNLRVNKYTILVFAMALYYSWLISLESFQTPMLPAEDPTFHLGFSKYYAVVGHLLQTRFYAPGMHYYTGLLLVLTDIYNPLFIGKFLPVFFGFFIVTSFYILAREFLDDELWGSVTTLMLISTWFMIHRNQYLVAETPAMIFLFLALYSWIRFGKRKSKHDLITCSLFSGGLFITHSNVSFVFSGIIVAMCCIQILVERKDYLKLLGGLITPIFIGIGVSLLWQFPAHRFTIQQIEYLKSAVQIPLKVSLSPYYEATSIPLTLHNFLTWYGISNFSISLIGIGLLIVMYKERDLRSYIILGTLFIFLFLLQFSPYLGLPLFAVKERSIPYLGFILSLAGILGIQQFAKIKRREIVIAAIISLILLAQLFVVSTSQRPTWYRMVSNDEFQALEWIDANIGPYDTVGVSTWKVQNHFYSINPTRPIYAFEGYNASYIMNLLKGDPSRPSYIMVDSAIRNNNEIYRQVEDIQSKVKVYTKGNVDIYRLLDPNHPIVTVYKISYDPQVSLLNEPTILTLGVKNIGAVPLDGKVLTQILDRDMKVVYEEYTDIRLPSNKSKEVDVIWGSETKTLGFYKLGMGIYSQDLSSPYYILWNIGGFYVGSFLLKYAFYVLFIVAAIGGIGLFVTLRNIIR